MNFFITTLRLCAIFSPVVLGLPSSRPSHQVGGTDSAINYVSHTQAAIVQLQTWYNGTTGLWGNVWWNSANAITMLADYQEYFPAEVEQLTNHVFPNTLAQAPSAFGYTNFLDDYYDDNLWWALAWIKVYEVTGQQEYLEQASSIFEDAKSVWGTATCGGLWWDKAHTQVNAIANTLYFTTAARLAILKPTTPSEYYYLNEATRSIKWIESSGLINSHNLLNDGLDLSTCTNNGEATFSYNQGVILTGLVELTWATGDASYTTLANSIATSAIQSLNSSPTNTLIDPCEPDACDGDEKQFKGIFARNVMFMVKRASGLTSEQTAFYKDFLTRNADSIWKHDMSWGKLGLVWGGPYQTASAQTQMSGLDALVGAAAVSM